MIVVPDESDCTGADDAQPHSGSRVIPPRQHVVQIRDAGAVIRHANRQDLGRQRAFDEVVDQAAAGVLKCIAREFGNGGGDAGLFERVEPELGRDRPRAAPGVDDVVLLQQPHGQQVAVHAASRPITTVMSSCCRLKSR